jgi:hypothetical protein
MKKQQTEKEKEHEEYKKNRAKELAPTFYKNLNSNLTKLEKLKKSLPELNNCDNIINHWSREFLTLFKDHCRKRWGRGIHLDVKNIMGYTSKVFVSSTIDIINNINELPFDRYTYIFISSPTSKNATMFLWKDRFDILKYNYLEKIDNETFKIWNSDKTEILQYREIKQIGFLKDIQRFQNMSLVSTCLGYTRKIGTQKSNQNSSAQKNRRGTKLKLEFHTPNVYNEEIKDMLDTYKIVAGKYNYKKSYRTFVREIHKNTTIRLEMDDLHCIIISLVSTPS